MLNSWCKFQSHYPERWSYVICADLHVIIRSSKKYRHFLIHFESINFKAKLSRVVFTGATHELIELSLAERRPINIRYWTPQCDNKQDIWYQRSVYLSGLEAKLIGSLTYEEKYFINNTKWLVQELWMFYRYYFIQKLASMDRDTTVLISCLFPQGHKSDGYDRMNDIVVPSHGHRHHLLLDS